jgi:hypothetical protein
VLRLIGAEAPPVAALVEFDRLEDMVEDRSKQ